MIVTIASGDPASGDYSYAASTHVTAALVMTDPRDTLHALRETLCVAQTIMDRHGDESGRVSDTDPHSDRLQRMIDEIDRQRPLGPDGTHGDLHTVTCGCDR